MLKFVSLFLCIDENASYVTFFCGHIYHQRCVSQKNEVSLSLSLSLSLTKIIFPFRSCCVDCAMREQNPVLIRDLSNAHASYHEPRPHASSFIDLCSYGCNLSVLNSNSTMCMSLINNTAHF